MQVIKTLCFLNKRRPIADSLYEVVYTYMVMSYRRSGRYSKINQAPTALERIVCSGIDMHYSPKSGVQFTSKYSETVL